MAKINCDVTNCSHNDHRVCFANRVNVAGGKAEDSRETCCASFLDRTHYSTLTNNTNRLEEECTAIVCDAVTCTYNENKLCYAGNIHVSGNMARIYEETSCETFKEG